MPIDRAVGQRLANFTLTDAVAGRPYMLYGYAGKTGVVLAFIGTTCPLGDVYMPRLVEISKEYRAKGFVVLGVNANAHESVSEIAAYAQEFDLDFPVLKDVDNVVADAALVERTPEVLVLDGMAANSLPGGDRRPVRRRRRRKPEPEHHYLRDALDAVAAKTPVETQGDDRRRLPDREGQSLGTSPSQSTPRVRPPAPELIAARDADAVKPADLGQATYASAAAAIIQNKCASCHRPGQVAPFSLQSYDDARKHAAMIREVVDNRRMPPWHADPKYGHFANDRSLTAEERATLLAWIEQGRRSASPSDDSRRPDLSRGLGRSASPTWSSRSPRSTRFPSRAWSRYVNFRVPTNFKEDRWVQAAEAVPGDRAVVHHIVVYLDTAPEGRAAGDWAAVAISAATPRATCPRSSPRVRPSGSRPAQT